MLLQRIELKGFLSYYGHEKEIGDIEPVIIDFQQSPLWLIHGKNGTGKTSLFDAIRFTLYKINRDGSKSNFSILIHDASQKAEVKLEIQIKDQLYQIVRTVQRTNKSAKVWGIVKQFINKQWQNLPNTEQKVEQWVQNNLKMSYETFSCAVLLQQGNADAFIKAGATERKTRLLELLDLEFYKKLGDRATQKSNQYKKEQSKIQQELDRLNKVTNKDIEAKEKIIKEQNKVLAQTKGREKIKQQDKNNTINAKSYQQQISEKQEQQKQYQTLIDKQESIVQNAREYREINDAVKQLDILWEKRDRLSKEITAIQQTEANLEVLQTELEQLNSELEQAKQEENKKSKEFESNNKQLEQYRERRNELSYQLKDLEQVERLEEQIRQVKKQLEPHLNILEYSQKIERKYQRYQELNVKVPLLQKLNNARQELKEYKAKLKKSATAVQNYEQQLETVNKEKSELNKQKDYLSQEIERSQKDLQNYQNKISNSQEKLEHRESVSHAEECPTCGSHLDNPEVQKRLEQECQSWKEQITNLKRGKATLNSKLESLEKSKSIIKDKLKSASDLHSQLNTELTRATVNLENLQNTVKENQQAVNSILKEAGKWREDSDRLSDLEAELQSLNTIPKQKQKLDSAKSAENIIKQNLDSYYIELEKLPKFSVEEREQLNLEQDSVTQLINDSQAKQQTIESEFKQLQSVSQKQDNQKRNKETEINSARDRLNDLQERKKKIKEEIAKYKNTFSSQWNKHPACENREALEQLRQQLNSLSNAEREEKEWQEAQKHFSKISGEINTLQALLEKIPVEHCRSIDDIDNELEAIQLKLEQIEKQIQLEKTTLIQMQSQKQQYEAKENELINVSKEFNYYKHLADTFGSKGLQAQIIQAAQEKIKLNANNILARLSDGRWQIDLQENETKTELAIFARDLRQSVNNSRLFESLSSGEKFIVAISLAVAIGQSIYSGRTVNSLVIDEGFGSLDDDKRPLMVSELKRLSEDVLLGGRVIVVSHQNDVCESFNSRYHIYRDKSNHVQVEPYINVPL